MTNFDLIKNQDYKISIDTWNNLYVVYEIDEETKQETALKTFKEFDAAQDYITARENRRIAGKKKEPLSALKRQNYSEFSEYDEVKITSKSGSNYWVVFAKNQKREKSYNDSFLKNTDENKKKLNQIQEFKKKVEEINNSLEKIDKEELEKYFESD